MGASGSVWTGWTKWTQTGDEIAGRDSELGRSAFLRRPLRERRTGPRGGKRLGVWLSFDDDGEEFAALFGGVVTQGFGPKPVAMTVFRFGDEADIAGDGGFFFDAAQVAAERGIGIDAEQAVFEAVP